MAHVADPGGRHGCEGKIGGKSKSTVWHEVRNSPLTCQWDPDSCIRFSIPPTQCRERPHRPVFAYKLGLLNHVFDLQFHNFAPKPPAAASPNYRQAFWLRAGGRRRRPLGATSMIPPGATQGHHRHKHPFSTAGRNPDLARFVIKQRSILTKSHRSQFPRAFVSRPPRGHKQAVSTPPRTRAPNKHFPVAGPSCLRSPMFIGHGAKQPPGEKAESLKLQR